MIYIYILWSFIHSFMHVKIKIYIHPNKSNHIYNQYEIYDIYKLCNTIGVISPSYITLSDDISKFHRGSDIRTKIFEPAPLQYSKSL